MSYNCPKCNSDRIYQEVTIRAKHLMNSGKIFDVETETIDCIFEPLFCADCGWSTLDSMWGLEEGEPDMTRIVGKNLLILEEEKPDKCELCGTIAELRPYGANGENICYECGMKNKEITDQKIRERFAPLFAKE